MGEGHYSGEVEARVESLLGQMTLEEKAALCAGVDLWNNPGVERLGVPPIRVTDGPSGARGSRWTGHATALFPCGSALGANWDPDLVRRVGECIGEQARNKGAHVLLAPTVNIHRHPLAGRNFECYSEDPHLTARTAVGYVEGVQSRGVGCSVKHFVANDQEHERMTISSEVSERARREIYLPPFEAAVQEAGVWSVMSAYNRLHGTYCSDHAGLLTDLLKREWGFDGFVVSDWFGTHSTVDAANAGLDLEMPGPPQYFGAKLAEAVRAGEVAEAVVDDKVRRLLRVAARTGCLDGEGGGDEVEVDDPTHRAVAYEAAVGSFVLLQNHGSLLPLDADRISTLALIGPGAASAHTMGGGSARVTPHYTVSPFDGIRERVGGVVAVEHERGCTIHQRIPPLSARRTEDAITVEYHNGSVLGGDTVLVEEPRRAQFVWLGAFHPAVDVTGGFSARLSARFVPDETGTWTFALQSAGRSRLLLDGEVVLDNWTHQERQGEGDQFFGFGSTEVTATVACTEGEARDLVVEYASEVPSIVGGLALGCLPPVPDDLMGRAVALASRADAVVLVVGTSSEWETEGHDRTDMELPGVQRELVERVAAANPNTVVVVNAAAPVTMEWADSVRSVMQCWFPGQEWGRALAHVLFGDADPGGRLPTTFPRRLQDTPAFTNYPGERGRVHYGEGVFVGYRWYDVRDIAPRWCFGHGLSYTTFEYGPLRLSAPEVGPEDTLTVAVDVTNTGSRPGVEVVQCYVQDVEASVARPPQELRGFAKLRLEPGETRPVELTLGVRAFAFWDVQRQEWTAEPGEFEIRVGRSSRDIRARATVTLG